MALDVLIADDDATTLRIMLVPTEKAHVHLHLEMPGVDRIGTLCLIGSVGA